MPEIRSGVAHSTLFRIWTQWITGHCLVLLALPFFCLGQRAELSIPFGHTAAIRSLSFSEDGRYLLSGSTDGTLKLWDIETGTLLKTSDNLDHSIERVVLSPDAQFAGYLWAESGNQQRVPRWWNIREDTHRAGLPVPEHFSTAAKRSAAQPRSWQNRFYSSLQDSSLIKHFLRKDRTRSEWTTTRITPDSTAIACGLANGSIELYELESGRLQQLFRAHTLEGSYVQFSPDDQSVYVGDHNGRLWVWDFERGGVSKVVGQANDGRHQSTFFWPVSGQQKFYCARDRALELLDLEQHTVQFLKEVPDDGTGVQWLGFSEPLQTVYLQLESENGTPSLKAWELRDSGIIERNLSYKQLATVLPNGLQGISWGRIGNRANAPLTPQIRQLGNSDQPGRSLKLARTYQEVPDRTLTSLDGKKLLVMNYSVESNQAITTSQLWDMDSGKLLQEFRELKGSYEAAAGFSADGQALLIGTSDNEIHLHDLSTGDLLHTYTGHRGCIISPAFSNDGNKMVSSSEDGTIKIWDVHQNQALATLINIGTDDWIVLGPDNLFDASPGAMKLMHYVIADDAGYEVIELEQLKARYYEPGLLTKLMGLSDERIRPVEGFATVELYPKVSAEIIRDTLHVRLQERNGGIGKLSLFINGKEIAEALNPPFRGAGRERVRIMAYDLGQPQNLNYLYRHPDSTNLISIRAYNEAGWLKSRAINFNYQTTIVPSANGTDLANWVGSLDPKLYVVSIGTANYTGTRLDLQYADQDAGMMAKAMQSVGTALFNNGDSLEVYCLSTAPKDSTGLADRRVPWQFATKKNIEASFRSIRQRAKAEDVLMVYLSGHGITYGSAEQAQFHYLTQGIATADLSDAFLREAYTISSEELTQWINNIPALKQVLIIDACNSGQILENLAGGTKALNSSQIRALDRMQDRTGMFVLSGSASNKVSYEAGEYGQGLLTYALLQGMSGVATRKDPEGKEIIDVMKLFQYARDRVPELAASINGVQTPMLGFPNRGASFDIGILDESAKTNIPIGNKKPVFIKNNFINLDSLRDDLKLTQQLEMALRAETEKGAAADLIYVDVSEYPNAYSLGGYYQVKPDRTIETRVKLFKGDQRFSLLISPTDDPERWVKLLVRAVKKKVSELEMKN